RGRVEGQRIGSEALCGVEGPQGGGGAPFQGDGGGRRQAQARAGAPGLGAAAGGRTAAAIGAREEQGPQARRAGVGPLSEQGRPKRGGRQARAVGSETSGYTGIP